MQENQLLCQWVTRHSAAGAAEYSAICVPTNQLSYKPRHLPCLKIRISLIDCNHDCNVLHMICFTL